MTEKNNNDEAESAAEEAEETSAKAPMDPVRKWTLIVLGACVVLMAWYLISDRVTPYTNQARVHALVVPIAPRVAGIVTEVEVTNNEYVSTGQELFRIDRDQYQLAVETAEANLQSARQATGASTANVEAARASVAASEAGLIRASQDAVRLRRIKEEDPGAISIRRLEQAEAGLSVAQSQLAASQANLEKAIQDLGEAGDENFRILQALATQSAKSLRKDVGEMKALKKQNKELVDCLKSMENSRKQYEADATRYRSQAEQSEQVSDTLRFKIGDIEKHWAEMERKKGNTKKSANGKDKTPPKTPPKSPSPFGLAKPEGEVDDLTEIIGIGKVFEATLHDLGIYHFRQIAAFGPAEIARINSELKEFKGRIEHDDWIGQAKELHFKKYSEAE